ncbi:MAG TPA: serine/threonine-protein kinase, partial [Thermoanaerobaculia bacterium]|nr:serine/threonine-protein kinase [Thermoanaerobaculia bacterium]
PPRGGGDAAASAGADAGAPPFWDDVRTLFQRAVEHPREAREQLLAGADPNVREEVESLLAAHDDETPFLVDRNVWQLIDAQQGERLAGTTIGQYRIVRQLGHGGMGTVFLANREHEEFSQRVAIKLVRGGDALVQRFKYERQILAALEHPNIARLLDGGTTSDGLPYLVMEYVEGTSIDAYAKRCTTIEKLKLFLQLCEAVQYAHRSLIIHRDIKPANVLVTEDGIPKLLDFGIARLVSESAESSTRVMTPDYASPEQLLGRAVTTATDVYSLGVLLFELLTGTRAFDASRTPSSEPPRHPSLRGDLEAIVNAATEVDPARRYGSVEKLADDVRRHLSGHPIAARRATFGYHATKFVRRNLLPVSLAVAIVVTMAVALAATLHQKRIAERRFEQVRSLARSVVFELHDAIAPLPGSTPARELLVRRALVYLDNLAAESQDNTPLRIELAGAYLKIGDVQGLPYRANLGDTAGALRSYGKALDIARGVYESDRENEEARTLLADAHDRMGFIDQRALRWGNALAHHEQARALRESLPRTDERNIALARTWTAVGDSRYIGQFEGARTPRQDYEAALAIASRVPPQSSSRRDALMELGRAHQHLGGYFTGTRERDLARAIRHHDAALGALGERAALDPSDAVARRNYADQFVMKATAQVVSGDAAGALASTERALEVLRVLAAADPKNVEAQHDLAFAYGEQGRALVALRRHDEAITALERAAAIHERRLADDPLSAEDRRDLGRVRALLREVRNRGR